MQLCSHVCHVAERKIDQYVLDGDSPDLMHANKSYTFFMLTVLSASIHVTKEGYNYTGKEVLKTAKVFPTR